MFAASRRHASRTLSVSDARSDPAKSTSASFPVRVSLFDPLARSFRATLISNTACDLELVAFASVGSVACA